MAVLVLGLTIFFAVHIFAPLPMFRAGLIAKLGEKRYRLVFSLASLFGLILVIAAYSEIETGFVLDPARWAQVGLLHGMPVAFILIAAAHMKTHIRQWLKHPMMIGIFLWAGMHLLANGELAATIVFGAFTAYALFSLAKSFAIGKTPPKEGTHFKYDLMAAAGGLALYAVFLFGHEWLFGVDVLALMG